LGDDFLKKKFGLLFVLGIILFVYAPATASAESRVVPLLFSPAEMRGHNLAKRASKTKRSYPVHVE
jgi:hypothetical protein